LALDTQALKNMIEGSTVSYRHNSISWIFNCPRCQKKDKLYIRKRDGKFVCWYCQTLNRFSGPPEFALCELLGVPIQQVKQELYGSASWHPEPVLFIPHFNDFSDESEEFFVEKRPDVYFPIDFYEIDKKQAEKGLAYLEGRGVPLAVAQKYGTRYHPASQRVVFPVFVKGVLLGWQTRLVVSDTWVNEKGEKFQAPKALTSDSIQRNSCVMFQDNLEKSRHAFVAEGPITAIKGDLVGGNIATMGKSISGGQIEILRKAGVKRVYWAIDPDAVAELTRLCRETSSDFESFYVPPMDGYGDHGDMSFDQVRYQVEKSAEKINAGKIFLPPFIR